MAITTTGEKPQPRPVELEHVDTRTAPGKSEAAIEAANRGQLVTGYEHLTVFETIKTFKLATLVCFAMAFSAATDGYQIGINASIIANKGFVAQFATQTSADGSPALASPILSGWSSIMSCGQIIGMTSLPFLSSRYGRKVGMYSYWLVLVGSVIAESVTTVWQGWLVGKLLAGIGVGCVQSNVPTYISEVAPVRIRGTLLMAYSLWWTLGSFFAQVALQHLSRSDPTDFRTPIYTQWAQLGLMLLIYLVVPETPAWCVNAGKLDRAKKELLKLHRGVENYDVDHQLQVLVMSAEHERALAVEQRREHWYEIFRGTNGLRTVISLWTNMSQQFIGLTLFGTFGTYFFQQAGIDDPFRVKVITSSIQIGTVLVLVTVVDFTGRRLLACSGTTLSWLSCIAIGIIGVAPEVKASTYIFVMFACFWNVGLAANGATGWGYIGEISSQRLRPYTAGFGAASTCVIGVIMNVLVPYMTNANEWNWELKTGWFYAGVGAPFALGMWFLIPETTGRSAAELDELFERRIKPWRFHKTRTATQRLVQEEAH
ncbi:putative MFS alpha-glucoside transporter [Aspergillus mulundensis]|uniref:Putative MFS alpha-glucoside transporter n=1 Tax=Aspergillus mulundensis TaxID=1810919 RepID=A0A3D8RL14_9EURO|nr:putative MFS alpha-glucoside transporter [Aspergillus mulundensis]RDW74636.1 putative MFS alpha-glucoside transporter [Aspergillus mulundensis]